MNADKCINENTKTSDNVSKDSMKYIHSTVPKDISNNDFLLLCKFTSYFRMAPAPFHIFNLYFITSIGLSSSQNYSRVENYFGDLFHHI